MIFFSNEKLWLVQKNVIVRNYQKATVVCDFQGITENYNGIWFYGNPRKKHVYDFQEFSKKHNSVYFSGMCTRITSSWN